MDMMNFGRLSAFRRRSRAGPGRVAPPTGRVIRLRPGVPR